MTRSFNLVSGGTGDTTIPLFLGTGAPVSGASGTFAGLAVKGALLLTDEPGLYQNTGTLASPTWTSTGTGGGSIVITGGTIDGATVGGTTPEPGTFTTLGSTGLATLANVSVTGFTADSVQTGITASTTQTQGQGPLTKQVNVIGTVANSGDTNTLAALTVGQHQDVYNDGAHPMNVFPASGYAIDGGTANAAVTLTNAKRCRFTCTAANVIKSAQLGAVSA